MIRLVNIAFIALAAISCLGLYRVAEGARIAHAELRATKSAMHGEKEALTVLGAEWARLTQPNRIQALASRHLQLSDRPLMELSSLSALPRRNDTPAEGVIRDAKVVVPAPALGALPPGFTLASMQTGM